MEEIAGAGTRSERRLGADEEHGFLWRLHTYWSYEERDGGLYLQVEAVSLNGMDARECSLQSSQTRITVLRT